MLIRLPTLRLPAMLRRIYRDSQVELGKLALQSVHDRHGRIARIAHAKDDLKSRIALVAERAQGLIELMLRTTQGLQHSDRRLNGRPGLPGTAPESHRQPCDDSVGHGERDEREAAAVYEPQFSSRAHPIPEVVVMRKPNPKNRSLRHPRADRTATDNGTPPPSWYLTKPGRRQESLGNG